MTRHASFFTSLLRHTCFSGWWFLNRSLCQIMVVRAGQPSGWPVSLKAGIPTPVRATTHERRNSSGSCNCYFKEAAIMATTLTPSHPEFVFVFAAVRRADRHPRICMLRTVAGDERSARRSLVRDARALPCCPSAGGGGVPCVIKKPLRPSQRVMTPVNTSALRLTISSTAPAPYPSLLGVI